MEEGDAEQDLPTRNLVLSVCDLKQHGDIPTSRCGAQTVTMATRMYLFGGCDESKAYGDLHLLEIEQMKWTLMDTQGNVKPSPRWGHSLVEHNSDLVLFGGVAADGELLGDGVAQVPPAPFADGTRLPSGMPDNSLFTLQTQSLTWQKINAASAPAGRFLHSHCCLVGGSKFYVFGGCSKADFSGPLNDLVCIELSTISSAPKWEEVSASGSIPEPRFGHKMISVGEQLLVFGGQGDAVYPGELHSFDLGTNTWSKAQVAGTCPLGRAFHSFDLIGGRAFAFAGKTASGLSDLYVLDTASMRWARPLYEGQLNVRAHATAVLMDKLIVFGGVRDKSSSKKSAADNEPRISKKLFFLNVLEVKGDVSDGGFKFKLVTVGDSGVGKSCLLTRFVQDYFADDHQSTIGVDFKTVVTMVKGRLVKLQLWDTAGQERFSVVTGNYYRNSDGFIFVYSCVDRESFNHIDQWMSQVQQHHDCGPTTIKVLVANQSDRIGQVQDSVSEDEGRKKAEEIGATFMMTSAKTAANVDMAFLTAAQALVEMRRKQKATTTPTVNLGARSLEGPGPSRSQDKKKNCCAGGS